MPEFDVVDLSQASDTGTDSSRRTVTGSGQAVTVARVDSADVAASLEAIRRDISAHVTAPDEGLALDKLMIRLTLSVEGKVAFVAKGAAEACFEVTFAARR